VPDRWSPPRTRAFHYWKLLPRTHRFTRWTAKPRNRSGNPLIAKSGRAYFSRCSPSCGRPAIGNDTRTALARMAASAREWDFAPPCLPTARRAGQGRPASCFDESVRSGLPAAAPHQEWRRNSHGVSPYLCRGSFNGAGDGLGLLYLPPALAVPAPVCRTLRPARLWLRRHQRLPTGRDGAADCAPSPREGTAPLRGSVIAGGCAGADCLDARRDSAPFLFRNRVEGCS
jgi:hypothetical protein